ncbi:MAG: porin [Pelomonas sp.]|nr:porin [Roseateles sp.]
MKKSLVALAVLGTLAGTAAAQSSVTAFGVVDLNVRYVKENGQSLWAQGTDGNQSSRLGFRGVEDLGGGMKAGFWLESGLNPNTGTTSSTSNLSGTQLFTRRATVSLMGDFGEVRLGRAKTGERTIIDDFDPFGTIGVGGVITLYNAFAAIPGKQNAANAIDTGATWNRSNNQFAYILPGDLGGFYGQVDVAPGQGAATLDNKYYGGRIGYKDGPIHVTAGFSSNYGNASKFNMGSVAGSYDFGVATGQVLFTQQSYNGLKQNLITVAAIVPMGQNIFRAGFTHNDANDAARNAGLAFNANLFAVGYEYDLSKRTALYTTVSEVTNQGKGKVAVTTAPGSLVMAPGGKSGGAEVGIRHSF